MSKKNIEDRLKFIDFVKNEGYVSQGRIGEQLRNNMLWTDESPIELKPKPNSQTYRIRTDNKGNVPRVNVPKFGVKILVAGGMTAQGVTELHIVKDGNTVDGNYYRTKILPIYLNALNSGLFTSKF